MSKTQAIITFLGKKRIIKKSVKNFRLALEFQKNDSFQQKELRSNLSKYSDLQKTDLGDEDNYSDYVDANTGIADASLGLLNATIEFVQDTLELSDEENTKLEDLTPEKINEIANKISNLIIMDESDPKK